MKIIIVGAGEVGFHIASRLSLENKDVVLIEKDPGALRRVSENLDVQTVVGCGSSPATLQQAGIKEADILLAVTNSDETNLVASLFANILSPTTIKLARIRGEDYLMYQEALSQGPYSIDMVINPEAEAVKTIKRLLQVPGAIDVGEFADGRIKVIGVRLDADCPVNGTKLVDLKKKTGNKKILVTGIVR
ncbi:MAG: NAD-binding protein, partial [Deltaproteobacteria bacterium]|nr:NAD-binding protein [Deltaproteobacteria bacterium]